MRACQSQAKNNFMSINLNKAIPSSRSVDGWKNVKIHECYDAMTMLDNYSLEFIKVYPQYYLQKIPYAVENCYCRKEVANLLLKAAENLPNGYKFLIWDAWRPTKVQNALFEKYKDDIKDKTDLTGVELDEAVQKYVSLPSTDKLKPSPHLTGASIDLTIIDKNGNELDMGTGFDYFGSEAQTDFYEIKSSIFGKEVIIKQNRRLLYNILTNAGFTNYPYEWWHYDYGNQFWGVLTNKEAIYNKIISPI
jgi:D-alanyl-D-alanine dipeptidase